MVVNLPASKRISMERHFERAEMNLSKIALHVGVSQRDARLYLEELIKTKQLPKNNKFVIAYRKAQLRKKQAKTALKKTIKKRPQNRIARRGRR